MGDRRSSDSDPGSDAIRPLYRREYDRLVELGHFHEERIELLQGALYCKEPQDPAHADVVAWLDAELQRQLRGRAQVRTQLPFALSEDSEPEPDLAIVPPGRYAAEHPARAFLLVEVAESSLRRDRTKARLYAAAGVPEYWLVNLVDELVLVHRLPRADAYTRVLEARRGATLAATAFPDLAIGVSDLLPPQNPPVRKRRAGSSVPFSR